MERDQHVIRVADKQDRRAKKVVLTEQGFIFWEQLQLKIYEFYRQTFDGFHFDDKVTFVHYLNKLNNEMKNTHLSVNK